MDILSDNMADFNALEKRIFDQCCEYGRNLFKALLEEMDGELARSRDRKLYRHKGKRTNTIKTLMGEVTYERNLYQKNTDSGVAHVFLLDEFLNMDLVGKFSTNLIMCMAESASNSSYRAAALSVSRMTGQSVSHGGVWMAIQTLGEKHGETEKARMEHPGGGEKIVPVLFEEADGVWINMQGKDRPSKGGKRELKLAVFYEGWEEKEKNRYETVNRKIVAGFCKAAEFYAKKEALVSSIYNTDEILLRVINGDGGGWIRRFADNGDTETIFQLDPFHKYRAITRSGIAKTEQKKIRELIDEGKTEEMFERIRELAEETTDESIRKKILTMEGYFRNEEDALLPYHKRGITIPEPPEGILYRNLGTMESTVGGVAGLRLKHRRASWSKAGATNLARIICLRLTGELYDSICRIGKMVLPEQYTKIIETSLSAAKTPMTDGKGYLPAVAGTPFKGAAITGGRLAIRNLTENRPASGLIYR